MDEADIALPSVEWGLHLIDCFDDLADASWCELAAYMKLTGKEIPPGECRIIINLGREAEQMFRVAGKADCPAPYQVVVLDDDARSAQIVGSLFARFKT